MSKGRIHAAKTKMTSALVITMLDGVQHIKFYEELLRETPNFRGIIIQTNLLSTAFGDPIDQLKVKDWKFQVCHVASGIVKGVELRVAGNTAIESLTKFVEVANAKVAR